MNKTYAVLEKKINRTNSISTIYVPKISCIQNTVKWYDDSKLIKKVK